MKILIIIKTVILVLIKGLFNNLIEKQKNKGDY